MTKFAHWFIIIMIIVLFFFLLGISTRQARPEPKKTIGTDNVFYAPDHNDGFFRAMVKPNK